MIDNILTATRAELMEEEKRLSDEFNDAKFLYNETFQKMCDIKIEFDKIHEQLIKMEGQKNGK